MRERVAGIYRIVCEPNGREYIGQSKDVYVRFRKHREKLRNGKHHNFNLQKDYDRYGEGQFNFEILEEIPKSDEKTERSLLNELETKHIRAATCNFREWNYVYNYTRGGDHEIMNEEARLKLSASIKKKMGTHIYQIDEKGNIINYFTSVKDCVIATGINEPQIYQCLKNWTKRATGFIFVRENDIEKFDISKAKTYVQKKMRPILQIDFNGNIVKEWESIKSASNKTGFDFSGIWTCLAHKCKTFKGYIWYYKDDFKNFDIRKHYGHAIGLKRFGQFTMDGRLIKIWNKAVDVQQFGYNMDCVSKCLNNKKPNYKKFLWHYIDKDFVLHSGANQYDSKTHKRIVNYEV